MRSQHSFTTAAGQRLQENRVEAADISGRRRVGATRPGMYVLANLFGERDKATQGHERPFLPGGPADPGRRHCSSPRICSLHSLSRPQIKEPADDQCRFQRWLLLWLMDVLSPPTTTTLTTMICLSIMAEEQHGSPCELAAPGRICNDRPRFLKDRSLYPGNSWGRRKACTRYTVG